MAGHLTSAGIWPGEEPPGNFVRALDQEDADFGAAPAWPMIALIRAGAKRLAQPRPPHISEDQLVAHSKTHRDCRSALKAEELGINSTTPHKAYFTELNRLGYAEGH